MNLRSEFFVAWRYLKPKRNAVSVITCISLLGVLLGVAVLIVVLAVMTGFTDMMKSKLLETQAHFQIYSGYGSCISKPRAVIDMVKSCGAKKALAVVRGSVLVQKDKRFLPKALIGLDPREAASFIDPKKVIKKGKLELGEGKIAIGTEAAKRMGLDIGDKLLIHSPEKLAKMFQVDDDGAVKFNQKEQQTYLPEEFTVSALFSFGKFDFDLNIMFVGLEDADEIFNLPWGSANSIYGWAHDPMNMKPLLDRLRERLVWMNVSSWEDMNKDLLGVLAVEKNMMFFLLIFIVLVAAFSIANTLITVVTQKTAEIGLFKALGATSGAVMRIFVMQGFLVGFIGSMAGCALGVTVVVWRNELMHGLSRLTGMEIFPKQFYYFDSLPAHIVTGDLILIVSISIVLCTVGALIPAWRAAQLIPAEALRHE